MRDVLILGLASAAIYAVAASGLVLTYTTSGIFNFAHGAVAMVSAFVFWQLTSPQATSTPVLCSVLVSLLVAYTFWLILRALVEWVTNRTDRGGGRWLALAGVSALVVIVAGVLVVATFQRFAGDGTAPLSVPFALIVTLFGFAPGLGLLIDRVLMRRLDNASAITRLVVPIGLLVALIQVASIFWSPDTARNLPQFFGQQGVHPLGVFVSYHQLIFIVVAVFVAVGLRILLYNTRTGIAMRAVVDSRDLASLNGVSPDRISALAWGLGCSLAGVAGVLIAPILSLDQTQLTLLVINAYAAAMVGRLRSLPMTAVGAAILGLSREFVAHYSGRLPFTKAVTMPFWLTTDTVPAIMLFVVLLVVPQEKEVLFSARTTRSRVPNPGWRTIGIASVLMVVGAAVAPSIVGDHTLTFVGYGIALGIIALSLVPLTGYAGQISLAPLAFAGIGAALMSTWAWGRGGNPLVLIPVVAICAAVGAVVALPALRLKGLYLALATFAFALFVEKVVLGQFYGFNQGLAQVGRLHVGKIGATSDRANLILLAVVFVLLGAMIAALRRGPFGRRLQAMKDSPAACATLGLDLTRLKVEVFALSAGIAGLGGALLGGWRGQVGNEQFSLLQGALPALPLVLLTVVGGIAAVAGALLGGILLAVFPLIGEYHPQFADVMTILPGMAGISLASNPDGAISQTVDQTKATWARIKARREGPIDSLGRRIRLMLLPPAPALVPERLAVGGSASAADIAAMDAELGFDWGRCDADPGNA